MQCFYVVNTKKMAASKIKMLGAIEEDEGFLLMSVIGTSSLIVSNHF